MRNSLQYWNSGEMWRSGEGGHVPARSTNPLSCSLVTAEQPAIWCFGCCDCVLALCTPQVLKPSLGKKNYGIFLVLVIAGNFKYMPVGSRPSFCSCSDCRTWGTRATMLGFVSYSSHQHFSQDEHLHSSRTGLYANIFSPNYVSFCLINVILAPYMCLVVPIDNIPVLPCAQAAT